MLLNESITLRPANPADWPAIAALLESHGLPLAGAREHLDTFLVATAADRIVGVAGAELHGSVALLRSVAVDRAAQGRGIGRRMVERMLLEARRRDVTEIYLLTTTAPDYFARFGFAAVERGSVPEALNASAECQGACPATATMMRRVLRERHAPRDDLPVAVIGAGPVGLAAAARLLDRGMDFVVFEASANVGANLLDYGHVRLFSPWRYNLDPAMATLLAPSGWQAPDLDTLPFARAVVDELLVPFAQLPALAGRLHLRSKVVAITRQGLDKVQSAGRDTAPFVLRVETDGVMHEYTVRAVIDASGTWTTPNPLGASGLPAIGEREHAQAITYGIPDILGAARARYAGRRTLVVGAGHSAANTLLALAALADTAPGTRFVWAVRSPKLARVFGGGARDGLAARGQLGQDLERLRDSGRMEFVSGLHVTAIDAAADGRLRVSGIGMDGAAIVLDGVDEIVCATGQRPDLTLTRELRVALDPALEATVALGPLVDPNLHSCGSVPPHGHRELSHPEPGFYTVGVKSYGRAPTFLMMTGYEQARSVVAAIAGDLAAADAVELVLPETGVCSVSEDVAIEGVACCGKDDRRDAPATAATTAVATTAAASAAATSSGACCAPVLPYETATARCCG